MEYVLILTLLASLMIALTLPPRLSSRLATGSRLLPPRSGLERRDFVHWPYPDEAGAWADVRSRR
jgi:multidrug efflux pump subunit AcrB